MENFYKSADEIASVLKSHLGRESVVKINTDTDPDGVTAGAILARCLSYFDIPFHVSFGGPPEEDDLKKLGKQDYDLFVFLDQGTGQYQIIKEHLLDRNEKVLILDHHPGEMDPRPQLNFLNPHNFELSGTRDVSTSGIVYSVVEKINKRFKSLGEIALIGALGDRQEGPTGFSGINQRILKQCLENGFLKTEIGLKLNGRDLPILDCLTLSIRPFLLGISGKRDESLEILKDLEIDPETTIEEIDLENEEKLRDEILKRIKIESSESLKRSLWGTIYTSQMNQILGPKNMHEYVTLLDSCEKKGKPEAGFSALLNDEKGEGEIMEIMENYQKGMVEAMNWLTSNREKIKTTRRIRYINIEDKFKSKMIGEILSIAIESYLIETDKPIFGLAKANENKLKVSARATPEYVKTGVSLGELLHKVSEELGGSGGGHDVAAAARLPLERKDEFIKKVDKFIENST